MITVDTRGFPEMLAAIEQFSQRRMKNAISTALTRTAKDVQAAEKAAIRSQIDRPKEFTVNSVGIESANSEKLVSRVYLKVNQGTGRGAGAYMRKQITGGSAHLRGFEVYLQARGLMPKGWHISPGKAAGIDRYGGISKNTLDAVIKGLTLVGPKRASKREIKAGGMSRWFYLLKPRGKLQPGVYITEHKKGPRQVLKYKQNMSYRPKYDFYGVADESARRNFPLQFGRAVSESLARMKAK